MFSIYSVLTAPTVTFCTGLGYLWYWPTVTFCTGLCVALYVLYGYLNFNQCSHSGVGYFMKKKTYELSGYESQMIKPKELIEVEGSGHLTLQDRRVFNILLNKITEAYID